MAELTLRDIGGINTYINPVSADDGVVLHCVNLDTNPLGGKKKRQGYTSFLNNPDSAQVNKLFNWTKNDGSTSFLYRTSGSILYFSDGTNDWNIAGNGTIANNATVSYTTMNNTLIVADGVGNMKYTIDGMNFSDMPGAAPLGVSSLSEFQGRVYAAGTASDLFFSASGTATDWEPVDESSSLFIPGGGKLLKTFKTPDRLISTKNNQAMYRWDGDSLVDMTTQLGPSSPESVSQIEDYQFWINRLGIYISNAGKPQLISNPIQRQIYNDEGTGMNGTQFDITSGQTHRYDYYVSAGTLTDDLVGEQIPRAIFKYNYQKNEFVDFSFAVLPTAWCSYEDGNGVQQLIFGDANGQVYKYGNGATSDNGLPIESSLQLMFHAGVPFLSKEWGYLEVMTNPGCQASVQIALQDTFTAGAKQWKEIGSLKNGFNQFRFPTGSRGKLLFVRIYESSITDGHEIYGLNFTYTLVNR